jgi:hypothetical protein
MIVLAIVFGPVARLHIMVEVHVRAKPIASWLGIKREEETTFLQSPWRAHL